MKKNTTCLLAFLLAVLMFPACTTVYKEAQGKDLEEEIIPPGETYSMKRKHALNVVYYIPSDMMPYEDWHYRLSGVTLHLQNYFYEGINRYMHLSGDAAEAFKFGLELNDVNPDFVKIHLIQSKLHHDEMKENAIGTMAEEVLAYFEANPGLKKSDHYLVWMPEYEGSFVSFWHPTDYSGMVFAGADSDRFKINYFESPRARATFLSKLGYIIKAFAQSCFVPESNAGREVPLLSIMGASHTMGDGSQTGGTSSGIRGLPDYNCKNYSGTVVGSRFTAGTPDKVRLMMWDAMQLRGSQLFNDDCVYEPIEVDIKKVKIFSLLPDSLMHNGEPIVDKIPDKLQFESDTLRVVCEFSTDAELNGVVLMDDPWRTKRAALARPDLDEDPFEESGWDAYTAFASSATFKELGANTYEVEFILPVANYVNLHVENKISKNPFNRELRLRFIGKNGISYPHAPTDGKGAFKTPLRNVYEVSSITVPTGTGLNTSIALTDIVSRYGYWYWKK